MRRLRVRPQPGQTLIEFALAVPMLILLIVTVMELGFLLYDYASLVSATRTAARAGAVYLYVEGCSKAANDQNREIGGGCSPVYGDNIQATLARAMSVRLGDAPAATVTYIDASPALSTRQGDLMQVQVSFQHRLLTGLFGQATIPMSANASARIE